MFLLSGEEGEIRKHLRLNRELRLLRQIPFSENGEDLYSGKAGDLSVGDDPGRREGQKEECFHIISRKERSSQIYMEATESDRCKRERAIIRAPSTGNR